MLFNIHKLDANNLGNLIQFLYTPFGFSRINIIWSWNEQAISMKHKHC